MVSKNKNSEDAEDDDMDIIYYFKILRKHWFISLIAFIVICGAVGAYTFMSSPTYEARSVLLITNQDQTSFLLGSSAPKPSSDLETQKVIILSPKVMNTLYQKYGVGTFTTTVNVIKNSNAVEIIVDADTAEKSMLIANDIAKSYLAYTNNARKDDANAAMSFISDQIAHYDVEIDSLNKQLIEFGSNSSMTSEQKLEYQTITREISAKNKLYDYLLSKREEAGLLANSNTGNVDILSYADLPSNPIKPNIALNMVLGVVLGVFGAFGAAFLVHKSRKN